MGWFDSDHNRDEDPFLPLLGYFDRVRTLNLTLVYHMVDDIFLSQNSYYVQFGCLLFLQAFFIIKQRIGYQLGHVKVGHLVELQHEL